VKLPSQLLRQTAVVNDPGDDLGDGPTWGPDRTIRCRVDWSRQLVRGPEGVDIYVTGTMLVRPEVTVDVGARVTVDGDTRVVFSVTPIYGPGANLAGRKVTIQ
jgi:hypothetical protein